MSKSVFILTDNIVKSSSINKSIYTELEKGLDVRYVSYKDNTAVKNASIDCIDSIFMLYTYLVKRRGSVCIYGMTEGVKDWAKLFILLIARIKVVRITNISTMNKKSNDGLSLVKRIVDRALFSTYLLLIKVHLLPRVAIYFTSKHRDSRYDNIKYKRIYRINSIHCDEINSCSFDESNEFIVFIDSNIPYHDDQLRRCSDTVNPALYYRQINDFLDLYVKRYNKKAVLCMHPSFDMSCRKDYFDDKIVVQHETFDYISKASLVVFHCSTAINYAVIMGKDIVQINSKSFNSFWREMVNAYQKKINCQQVMLEDKTLKEYQPYSADVLIDNELCGCNRRSNSILKIAKEVALLATKDY